MPKASDQKKKASRAAGKGPGRRAAGGPATPKAPPPPPGSGRRVGRPGDLTVQERRQLLGMLGIGVPPEDACHAVGLHPSRFRAWMDERDEDPEVAAFRAEVLSADGKGIAQMVKTLWDGGKTVGGKVEVSKTICEQHRFLLSRRRPEHFSGAPFLGGGKGGGHGPGSGRGDPVEPDVAEQIVAVLESVGTVLPPEVLSAIGVGREERP